MLVPAPQDWDASLIGKPDISLSQGGFNCSAVPANIGAERQPFKEKKNEETILHLTAGTCCGIVGASVTAALLPLDWILHICRTGVSISKRAVCGNIGVGDAVSVAD